MRRPEYVPAGAHYVAPDQIWMPTQSINSGRVWRTYLLATLISLTVALAVLLVILASGPTTVQAPGRTFVTPQTYGPPGPSGGFTSLPVVP